MPKAANLLQEYTPRMALDRRAFLAGMVATLVPCSAGAQPQRGLPAHRIGWISTEAQPDLFVDGFREGLRRHGYPSENARGHGKGNFTSLRGGAGWLRVDL